jgi:hypothetical protein
LNSARPNVTLCNIVIDGMRAPRADLYALSIDWALDVLVDGVAVHNCRLRAAMQIYASRNVVLRNVEASNNELFLLDSSQRALFDVNGASAMPQRSVDISNIKIVNTTG